jgi:DNA-binding response OmpR family regulator
MAKNVELMCHMAGHSCDTIGLGEQAVELGKSNEYDIIVLDIMLPDIDGYQVIGRLRQSGIDTPILIQFGLVDRGGNFDDSKLKGGAYLVKPFTRNELIDRMQAVISGLENKAKTPPQDPPSVVMSSRHDGAERRQHRRFATLKTGEVTYRDSITPAACIILNLSYGGAEIRFVDADFNCPLDFALKLQAGPIHNCKVRWRLGDRVGVQFL